MYYSSLKHNTLPQLPTTVQQLELKLLRDESSSMSADQIASTCQVNMSMEKSVPGEQVSNKTVSVKNLSWK